MRASDARYAFVYRASGFEIRSDHSAMRMRCRIIMEEFAKNILSDTGIHNRGFVHTCVFYTQGHGNLSYEFLGKSG